MALGIGVPGGYLEHADKRARLYVRWMGLIFAPLHILFIFTDSVIAGSYDPRTYLVRVPMALGLLIPGLLTFLDRPLPWRQFLFFHAIVWLTGQTANCYFLRDMDAALYTVCLVYLAAPFMMLYEPIKFIALCAANFAFYVLLIEFGLDRSILSSAGMSHAAPLLGTAVIGSVLAIITWERNLREWNHLAQIEQARESLEENDRRTQKELRLAERVQRSLLPKARYSDDFISIDFCYLPANNVGGDLLDIIRLEDGVYGLLIADVSGHGFASALISSMMKMLVHAIDRELLYKPGELLKRMDQLLRNNLHNEFITSVYAVVNLQKGTLEYATAGHEAPVIFVHSTGELVSCPSAGRALGIFPNSEYRSFLRPLAGDETLFFFTDGCFEVRNAGGALMELEAFLEIVREGARLPFEHTIDAIVSRIKQGGGGVLEDDVTLLACQLLRR